MNQFDVTALYQAGSGGHLREDFPAGGRKIAEIYVLCSTCSLTVISWFSLRFTSVVTSLDYTVTWNIKAWTNASPAPIAVQPV